MINLDPMGNLEGFDFARGGDPKRVPDSAEQITVSSLALLKMLKHGRAGVPMEVMGLMLGTFVDEYTTKVVDVFAMPQSGTQVTVESVDEVFQFKMLQMLKKTDRSENAVGWYHSHPGFGCWLSGVDVNTQQSFERLDARNIAVVVDPIQSVKGKVVIDAFRLTDKHLALQDEEVQQNTSNVGQLKRPTVQALIHGLNKHYYSLVVNFQKNEHEQNMLLNLYKRKWTEGLRLPAPAAHRAQTRALRGEIGQLAAQYAAWVKDENKKSSREFAVAAVGRLDPKRHLRDKVDQLRELCLFQVCGMGVAAQAF